MVEYVLGFMAVVLVVILVVLGIFITKVSKLESHIMDIRNNQNNPALLELILKSVVSKVWEESGLSEKVGEISSYAAEMKNLHSSIETMLKVPTQRGAFGEVFLEEILKDQLPHDMFRLRSEIPGTAKKPDAYIESTVGKICIDSKFPLENYKKMMETDDSGEKEALKKRFLNDVRKHLEKVRKDYIIPDKGTADFAFVFIPSEGVYWFLANEGFELLREYAKKGVQVVSPLTLSHKIELIKAGVHAKKLSYEAKRILDLLRNISYMFNELDETWRVSQKHLDNFNNKIKEFENKYQNLREKFGEISKMGGI